MPVVRLESATPRLKYVDHDQLASSEDLHCFQMRVKNSKKAMHTVGYWV